MRFGMMLAAGAALVAAVPVSAATIVQTSSNRAGIIGQVSGFDQSLGRLNTVTLVATALENRVGYVTFANASAPVTYQLNGAVDLGLRYFNNAVSALGSIGITGSGTKSVGQYGEYIFSGAGNATFLLDPSMFITGDPYLLITNNDPGFRNGSQDTSFASTQGFNIAIAQSACGGGLFGDENCNTVSYRLTYDYTPTGSVPEPATWALMILGMGAVGYAMRRRTTVMLAH